MTTPIGSRKQEPSLLMPVMLEKSAEPPTNKFTVVMIWYTSEYSEKMMCAVGP